MRRRAYLAGLGTVSLTSLAGCTAFGEVATDLFGGEPYDIGMTRNKFTPKTYAATVGERVVWKNTSESVHTITAYEGGLPDGAAYFATGGFESEQAAREAWNRSGEGGFSTRDTFAHTFEVPGTYGYCCIPHEFDGDENPRMVGSIEVTE
ncbi:cupredoxin domain-containing protein [Halovivax limisalsi]|uniref:cupredoxin domain-containing protein n=1 Tax=Halovivax limisalsi TaxID=1453760 RepID=UPI001FFD0C0D|nr:plastocyanin/azurin family copper-binding protein [Halovivax limisalsi]